MPEGPEVKKTVDGLRHAVENREVHSLTPMTGRYSRKDFPGFGDFCDYYPRLVTGVGCKGKFIYFLFANGSSLWNTLGMTGYWSQTERKHSRLRLWIKEDGQEERRGDLLFYNDMRNFGTFKYVKTHEELEKKLSSLGPDLLSDPPSFQGFKACLLKGKRAEKTIAENIMNQSVVSGVGNYLKAEILYDCKISPHRVCSELSDTDLKRILDSSVRISRLSYESGGATIRNYRDTSGGKGVYTRRFAVYNQESDPLGNEVIREVTKDKRTTHWVPSLQT